MTDDHLIARLASMEQGMANGFASLETRIEHRFQTLEQRLHDSEREGVADRVEVAKTSTKVSLIIGSVTFIGSLSGSLFAVTQLS